jgi:hypothetical protein
MTSTIRSVATVWGVAYRPVNRGVPEAAAAEREIEGEIEGAA